MDYQRNDHGQRAIDRNFPGRAGRSICWRICSAGHRRHLDRQHGAGGSGRRPGGGILAQVGKDLMAAARTRSPGVMTNVIERHGDVAQIGLYSLGEYRTKLAQAERPSYYQGMARFIGRYAATEAPKYQVARVEWANRSVRGTSGLMVDSRVILTDGTGYDVRWLLFKYGNSYKVRDAMVLGFWMTPFLKTLFEDYISKNGGNPRALTAALSR
jgi:phospholipid transport system substrate-binding protein